MNKEFKRNTVKYLHNLCLKNLYKNLQKQRNYKNLIWYMKVKFIILKRNHFMSNLNNV